MNINMKVMRILNGWKQRCETKLKIIRKRKHTRKQACNRKRKRKHERKHKRDADQNVNPTWV